MSNCSASCTSVRSPLIAAIATFALKADVWFRRGLLLMLSPDSRANLARCQAEAPLIALCRFPKPALIVFRLIASVAHQTASRGELAILEDGRHRVATAQSSKLFAPASKKRPRPDDEPACSQLDQGWKHPIEIAFRARVQDMELHSEGMGCRLQTAPKSLSEGGTSRVNEHAKIACGRQQFVQQLEPLRPHLCIQVGHAGQIAAGPAQACNKSNLDGVD